MGCFLMDALDTIFKILTSPEVITFAATYVATRTADGIIESIGKRFSVETFESQLVECVDTALFLTYDKYNWEYNSKKFDENFVGSLQNAVNMIESSSLKELLRIVLSAEENDMEVCDEAYDYFVALFDYEICNPKRTRLNNFIIHQHLRNLATNKKLDIENINWCKYRKKLESLIHKNMPHEEFSVNDIYVQLFGQMKIWSEDGYTVEEHIIIKSEEWLMQWTSKVDAMNIVLVSGKPASGKTTLLKRMAKKLANLKTKVVFIQLSRFNFTEDFHNSVSSFCKLEIGHDVFNEISDSNNIVLLFDALDEISSRGVKSLERATDFIDYLLKVYSERSNVKVVISGRDAAVNECSKRFKYLKQEYIIHLFPLCFDEKVMDDWYINPNGEEYLDLRPVWWNNFGIVKNTDYSETQDEIMGSVQCQNETFDEITGEPFMLYLLATSYEDKLFDFDNGVSVNRLYEHFFAKIFRKEWDQNLFDNTRRISEKQFSDFLKQVALCAWHSGKRTIPINEVSKRCNSNMFSNIISRFSYDGNIQEGITALLLIFYIDLKNKSFDEQSFEFSHKSFSDYFTGIAISESIINYNTSKLGEKEQILMLFDVLGRQFIDTYIDDFMRRKFQDFNETYGFELNKICEKLSELFILIIDHKYDLDMYEKYSAEKHFNADSLRVFSKNIFRIVCALSKIRGNNIKFAFSTPSQFAEWINTKVEWFGYGYETSEGYLTNLQRLIARVDFESEKGLFFEEIHLADFEIAFCTFRNVPFARADFHFARIYDTVFENSSFFSANMSHCKLYNVTYFNANKNYNAFEFANFLKAVFQNSSFSNANFEGAILTDAAITDTDFQNCSMIDCMFMGTTFENVNFADCEIEGLLYKCSFKNVVFGGCISKVSVLETSFDSCYYKSNNGEVMINAQKKHEAVLFADLLSNSGTNFL